MHTQQTNWDNNKIIMMKRINILVTGAGSSVGQGIYKSLEQSSIKKTIL